MVDLFTAVITAMAAAIEAAITGATADVAEAAVPVAAVVAAAAGMADSGLTPPAGSGEPHDDLVTAILEQSRHPE
jgi:hypothetical protein